MKTTYKIWIEIERCDTNDEGEEEFSDCDFPIGVAYRDTFEEAQVLQELIVNQFDEL